MEKELKESQLAKQRDIDLLRKRYTPEVREQLDAIDYRLAEYFDSLTTDVSIEFGDENDRHNRMEVLCGARFIRLFNTYNFNTKFVKYIIWLREGTWKRQGKMWRYVENGLKLPSTAGAKVYRWQPFQIFVLASVFGFQAWFNTHVEAGTKPDMLPSERERDGMIWDFRRLITEFIMYGPRKIDKTGLSSYIQVIFFLFGDFNSEIYSLAMTQDQSKILFDRTKFMLAQLTKDQSGKERFRMTEKIVDWKKEYQREIRNSKIVPLTGGGKAPDGTNTELLDWDELGSSPYTNGKSDMQAHINVCQSSMGQRRQPLTFGTTTAGVISNGPFIEKLAVLHSMLEREHDYESGKETPTQIEDGTMCLLLEPDEYEREDEQYVLTSHALRRKINPMLGLVVQYDFYEREMDKARKEGGQKFAECVAKLFNVYQTGRVTKWIKADRIRQLQTSGGKRIDDCQFIDGQGRERWHVFCGMDFSSGDDLFALTYLAVDWLPSDTMKGRFFADTDCWVLEKTMNESPNRPLYEQWIEQGWLHKCPGEVFDSAYAINRIAELVEKGINIYYFGYDPAQSLTPINNLKAWLQTLFQKREGMSSKDIADAIQHMVIPVSQTSFTQNPRITELEEKMLSLDAWMEFSDSPLWPWCFGNCAVESKGDPPIRRIVKGAGHSNKIDPVHGLLDALYCFDLGEGKVSE